MNVKRPTTTTTSHPSKRQRLQPVQRPRLQHIASLSDAVACLQSAQHIMVLVGAGISVSCGVPDFRSRNGLYALAQRLGLELNDPQELFDIHCFDDDEGVNFYKFAHALWPRPGIQPSPTHRFLSALDRAGRLLRVYTQNIDGLERAANITSSKIIECHGTLLTAKCRGNRGKGRGKTSKCRAVCNAADLCQDVAAHQVPRCQKCGGVWKPDVTFFGEPLVEKVGKTLEKDRGTADALLVIGTSLQVAPISKVMGWLPHEIPQILINYEVVAPPRATSDGFDVSLIGEADVIVAHLAAAMGLDIERGGPPGDMDMEGGTPGDKGDSIGDIAGTATSGSGAVHSNGVAARGPDAVVERGAVWAPEASRNQADGELFVRRAAELLTKDAADVLMVETVTCDACTDLCGSVVWACQACFGYDLCGRCFHNGGVETHQTLEGSKHTFVKE
jgi:NAD-dependent SIR2 family protein deacetylase